MKYEKPKLIKLSDFSHHLCYGVCSGGNNPNQGGGNCAGGISPQGVGNCSVGTNVRS